MYSSNIKIIAVNKENGNYHNNENISENNSISKIQHHTNFKNQNSHQSERITTNKNTITQQTSKKRINNNNTNNNNGNSHNYSNRKKFLNNNNNTIKIQNIFPTKNILHNIVNIKKNSIDYNNNNNINNNNNNGANLVNSISYSGKAIKNISPLRSKNHIKSNNIKINNNINNNIKNNNNNKNINNKNINNSSLNNNNIPQLEVSMVMNSTPSITDQNTTTVNATNSTTTIVPNSVSPSAAASYSLDFLHSVGVQMTIGGSSCSSSRGYTPTPSPSPPQQRSQTSSSSYLNATTNLRNRYSYTMQDDVNLTSSSSIIDNQNLNNNNNANKEFNNYDQYDHLNGRLPSSSTSSTIRSNNSIGAPILTSRGLTYNPHQLYSNNNYSHNHAHQHQHHNHHHQQQQQQQSQQQQQQQHQNQYYLSHQQQQHHPSQYQNINSGLHYNNNNTRNHHQHHQAKKLQNTFNNTQNNNNSNIKKTYNHSITNKYGNSLTTGINDLNNNNSSQTLPRTRNHQNFNNLTYVLTDGNKFVNNSRSPTPSPKSESPLIFRQQQQQNLTENLSANSSGIITTTANYDQIENSSISAISTTSAVEKSSHGGISFAASATTNDYESDSSHSSYRHNEKTNNNNNNNNNNNSSSNNNINNNNTNRQIIGAGAYHLGDINSIISFSPAYSEEDIFKTHGNYYGSHQNLTYWNVGINPPFSPYGVYSPNNISSSEMNNQYVNDTGTIVSNIKRSQSAQRGTFRGRRHLFPSFRAHSFHENIYTPPDKFLARAHLIEIKEPPQNLLNGTKWDPLTQDIWNKFMASQQTEETYKKKMYLWRYLYVTIKKAYPRYGLYLVGSTISGFGADTSDVDMCIVSRNATSIDPRMEALFNLTLLKEYLGTLGVFENFNLIEAKVPILRFRDSMHTLEVDLNFNNCVGIRNTHLLHCYSQLDWRLKPLVLITKLWAQFHNINNAKNMTISSYSLVLMVIHFLQYAISPPVLPCLHEMFPEKFQIILKSNDFGFVDMNEDIGHYESQNNQTIGELLLLYLEYYSNFDYAQYAISVRTGAVLPIDVCRQAKSLKNDIHQWKELCIEEPFDLTNTARSVYDFDTFERIKAVFIASWKVLHETLDINSIFSPIIQTAIPHVPLSVTPPIS